MGFLYKTLLEQAEITLEDKKISPLVAGAVGSALTGSSVIPVTTILGILDWRKKRQRLLYLKNKCQTKECEREIDLLLDKMSLDVLKKYGKAALIGIATGGSITGGTVALLNKYPEIENKEVFGVKPFKTFFGTGLGTGLTGALTSKKNIPSQIVAYIEQMNLLANDLKLVNDLTVSSKISTQLRRVKSMISRIISYETAYTQDELNEIERCVSVLKDLRAKVHDSVKYDKPLDVSYDDLDFIPDILV